MRRKYAFAALCALFAAVAQAAPPSDAHLHTVTLITGDQVQIATGNQASVNVTPRKGREHIQFMMHYQDTDGGASHLYVMPSDATPLIASGSLDARLFDVTDLLESKYDDSSRSTLPIIITYTAQSGISASATQLAGATITGQLQTVNGLAATADKADGGRFWDSLAPAVNAAQASTPAAAVKKIWLDRRIKPVLDYSVPQIGAPAAWNLGYEGTGVRVAVVDSGIDGTHPDLAGKVVAERNFTTEDIADVDGHGTHVASTIAGTGAASGGRYRGVAPRAELISAKVCEISGCATSAVIEGMEWAVMEAGARIVNISLGGPDEPGLNPMEEAINQLTENYGALFVVAAGNAGPGWRTLGTPGAADAALAVGAVNDADAVASFSSRGPRWDSAVKPEITAPGVNIIAARPANVYPGPPVGEFYAELSGTSMATPHVAGAAALLAELHPEWGAAQLKAALMNSARFAPGVSVFSQGAGRVDVAAAFAAQVLSEPASISLGIAVWPHSDDPVITRAVTYRNTGSAAKTLALSLEAAALDGQAAPAGMFSLNPSTINVPAGGTAAVTLTVDTRVSAPEAVFGGRIFATSDGANISTPFSIDREPESYDITLRQFDQNGEPAAFWNLRLLPFDGPFQRLQFITHEVTLRLRAGRYALDSIIPGASSTFMAYPSYVVDGPDTLTFDARQAEPIYLTKPVATAERLRLDFGVDYPVKEGLRRLWFLSSVDGSPQLSTLTLGESAPEMFSYLSVQWTDPGYEGGATEADPLYAGAWLQSGRLVRGGTLDMPADKRTVVRSKYVSAFPDIHLGLPSYGVAVNGDPTVIPNSQFISLPAQRTEYLYSTGGEVRWRRQLDIYGNGSGQFTSGDKVYFPRLYFARWNEPPFAPAFDATRDFAIRSGDSMYFETPLFGDREGHMGFIGSARIALYRDGEKIGEGNAYGSEFTVPAVPATYRAEASGTQTLFGLSTRVDATWNFHSQHVQGDKPADLPLMSVRFKPVLNALGQAPRAQFELPISVSQIGRRAPIIVGTLNIEASFDDGITWQKVLVRRTGEDWVAVLDHPASAQFVSLKAQAQDLSTNSVEITVIRAYALTDPAPPAQ
jgi:subtilisin family serine protease